jgi:hypothetical protein
MNFGRSKPLRITAGWAAGAYLVAIGLQAGLGGQFEISLCALTIAFAGAIYINVFEHAWHRYAMHSRRPDPRHARHHRLFYGSLFQTTDKAALNEVTTAWYIFPLLLAVHYPLFILLFGAPLAPAFFLGVVLHFVTYEITHWYTHMADNGFDRVLARVPGLSQLRTIQIEHHRLHHADPMVNFNFTPPYVGDRLAGVLRR